MNKLIQPIITLGSIAIVSGLLALIMLIVLSPVIDTLKECESRGWDGSEYNTGVKTHHIGENFGDDTVIKCNKEENETDAMIDLLDAVPFINIRESRN